MKRSRLTVLGALLAAVLLAAACSSSDDPAATDEGPEEAPSQPEPTAAEPEEAPPQAEPADPEPEEAPSQPEPAEDTSGEEGSSGAGSEDEPAPAPTEEPPPVVPEGSTVGITDDSITVAVLRSDTTALEEAGILPFLGDLQQNYRVFAQLANENGGAGGRDIEVVFHSFPPGAAPSDQQAACIAATEDDEAAVVHFVGGVSAEAVLCATEGHDRITYMLSGVLPQSIFDRSNDLLFSHSVTTERLMAAWPSMLDANGTLQGATLGLIRGDIGEHEVAAEVLEAALGDLGYELAEQLALPCQGTACGQVELAVERMQSAGVDTVFSLMPVSAYAAAVGIADAAGWDPQWLSSDIENQVFTAPTQAVFSRVAEPFDGTIGLTYGLDRLSPDLEGEDCYDRFSAVTGASYESDSDAWSAVASACEFMTNLVAAANWSQDTYGTLNQTTLVEGFETLTDYRLGDIVGSWSDDKHNAPDIVTLKTFSAECVCWTEIEGARTELE
ncbi:ABC transporter substrate-binding protein [Candidatus Poriferisocius sp.]|uniref:ABC transporter substrate-binding protein n=1 Tax=Candidatus Poriferisocius sp. TaxID=3101276 RepID=UPI003B59886D